MSTFPYPAAGGTDGTATVLSAPLEKRRPRLTNLLSFRKKKKDVAPKADAASVAVSESSPAAAAKRTEFVPPPRLDGSSASVCSASDLSTSKRRQWKSKNDQLVADFFAVAPQPDEDEASQGSKSVWSAWSAPARAQQSRRNKKKVANHWPWYEQVTVQNNEDGVVDDDEITLSSAFYPGSVGSMGSFSSLPSVASAPVIPPSFMDPSMSPETLFGTSAAQFKKKKKKRGQWMRNLWKRARRNKSSHNQPPEKKTLDPNQFQAELSAMSARYHQEYIQPQQQQQSQQQTPESATSGSSDDSPIPMEIATADKKSKKYNKKKDATADNDDDSDVGSVMSILSGVLQAWSSEREAIMQGEEDHTEESKITDEDSEFVSYKPSSLKAPASPQKKTLAPIRYTVAFSVVQIREYERTVGDNPSCTAGPPISLGWEYRQTPDEPIAVHANRSTKRSKREFHLAASTRTYLLQNEWEIPETDLRKARREATYIQYCREKSAFTGGESASEATFLKKTAYTPPSAPETEVTTEGVEGEQQQASLLSSTRVDC